MSNGPSARRQHLPELRGRAPVIRGRLVIRPATPSSVVYAQRIRRHVRDATNGAMWWTDRPDGQALAAVERGSAFDAYLIVEEQPQHVRLQNAPDDCELVVARNARSLPSTAWIRHAMRVGGFELGAEPPVFGYDGAHEEIYARHWDNTVLTLLKWAIDADGAVAKVFPRLPGVTRWLGREVMTMVASRYYGSKRLMLDTWLRPGRDARVRGLNAYYEHEGFCLVGRRHIPEKNVELSVFERSMLPFAYTARPSSRIWSDEGNDDIDFLVNVPRSREENRLWLPSLPDTRESARAVLGTGAPASKTKLTALVSEPRFVDRVAFANWAAALTGLFFEAHMRRRRSPRVFFPDGVPAEPRYFLNALKAWERNEGPGLAMEVGTLPQMPLRACRSLLPWMVGRGAYSRGRSRQVVEASQPVHDVLGGVQSDDLWGVDLRPETAWKTLDLMRNGVASSVRRGPARPAAPRGSVRAL